MESSGPSVLTGWALTVILVSTLIAVFVQEAAGDQKCWTNFGYCQHVNNECSGTYVSYLCNGPYTRRCCVPEFKDNKCLAETGKCQSTSIKCFDGDYKVGLCGGPSNRRCCIPKVPTGLAVKDARCVGQGGTCNDTSAHPCQDGRYVAGMCGGPTARRCCLPYGANSLCKAQEVRLACELFRSSNVLLRGVSEHQTSEGTAGDNSSPYNNLKDMCEGRMASRSSNRCGFKCQESGGSTCLKEKLLGYLKKLQSDGLIVVNALSGSCQSCAHYRGLAVDLNKDSRLEQYVTTCWFTGGKAFVKRSVVRCKFA